MPVMVLYKDKSISVRTAEAISQAVADVTNEKLKAKIEVRVIEPVASFHPNEIHLEMRYREFNEWSDEQIEDYHQSVMVVIGKVLADNDVDCAYSFYILPSAPPRSIWAQGKSK
jgi:hypothetical protein